jgi:chemotaxis protein CheC
MNATPTQVDALRELINIGYGRAGAALSELTQARVTLEAPKLVLMDMADIEPELRPLFADGLTCVNQVFSGALAGNALLLLDGRSANILTNLVTRPEEGSPPQPDISETLVEVGNIVLSACLGVFGHLLRFQVGFTVPELNVGSVASLLRSFTINSEPLSSAMLVHTRFTIRASNVKGYLGILLGVASTERLLAAVDEWGEQS